jgi:hypothetical protein
MMKIDVQTALTRVPSGMAARLLGVDRQHLYKLKKRGEIEFEITASNRCLFNVSAYVESKKKVA